MPVRKLTVRSIVIDPDLQPRLGGLDDEHIRALCEAPGTWPPIVVTRQGTETILLDGAHRYAAAGWLELEEIAAEFIDVEPDQLRETAFRLNARHGRALTLRDRRAHARYRLLKDPVQSNQAIAADAGLSPTTVQSLRSRLEAEGETPRTYYEPSARSRVVGARPPGALPDEGLGAVLGDRIRSFLEPPSRTRLRQAARYLERLSAALDDRHELLSELPPEAVAAALVTLVGDDRAREIGDDLLEAGRELVEIANGLIRDTAA